MKDIAILLIYGIACIAIGIDIAFKVNSSQPEPQPMPEPFELRTIQVQQGKALITLCIDKRTETAVPCTAFYTLP